MFNYKLYSETKYCYKKVNVVYFCKCSKNTEVDVLYVFVILLALLLHVSPTQLLWPPSVFAADQHTEDMLHPLERHTAASRTPCS